MNNSTLMLKDTTFVRIKITFWVNFVVGLITFFCPFIDDHIRAEVYWKILEDFVITNRGLENGQDGLILILVLLTATFFWLPMMGYAFYRYTIRKRGYTIQQRLINYFLFGIGSTIYLLPAYILYDDKSNLNVFSWGYWLLLLCTTVMFTCYIIIQKEQLIDELDISEHLIDDEK